MEMENDIRPEAKIRMLLKALHANQKVIDAVNDYVGQIAAKAYKNGYEDCENAFVD